MRAIDPSQNRTFTSTTVRKDFPGVQDALGVQHRLDALHDCKLGWAAREVHEVFGRTRCRALRSTCPRGLTTSANSSRIAGGQRVVPRRLVEFISEDVDVQVAVAGVAVTDGPEAMLCTDALTLCSNRGNSPLGTTVSSSLYVLAAFTASPTRASQKPQGVLFR